jgi:hypothetical protein
MPTGEGADNEETTTESFACNTNHTLAFLAGLECKTLLNSMTSV